MAQSPRYRQAGLDSGGTGCVRQVRHGGDGEGHSLRLVSAVTDKSNTSTLNFDRCRDTHLQRAFLADVSVANLLDNTPSSSRSTPPSISGVQVRPNGNPLVQLSTGASFVYDQKLRSWVELFALAARSGPLDGMASQGGSLVEKLELAARAGRNTADHGISLAEVAEDRFRACALLGSAAECRSAVRQYAAALADEGASGRLDDLLADLWGPLYQWVLQWTVRIDR